MTDCFFSYCERLFLPTEKISCLVSLRFDPGEALKGVSSATLLPGAWRSSTLGAQPVQRPGHSGQIQVASQY
jgi:hypothetical protein